MVTAATIAGGPKGGAGGGRAVTQIRNFFEYTDVGGNFLRASNWVFAPALLSALEAAVQAGTNANLLFATNGLPVVGTTTPSGNDFPLVTDLALFNFQTGAGAGLQLVVPAPVASMFGPTNNTIDPTNPLAAAIIAAVIGCLGDVGGNAASAFIAGTKASRRVDQVNG